jgi:hypothetical protein
VTPPAEPRQAQPGLTLRTLGHACLALYRYGEAPLLITDPWLIGSVYWRSWWLQNYPTPEEVDWLTRSRRFYTVVFDPEFLRLS